jgi:hypothetical protein
MKEVNWLSSLTFASPVQGNSLLISTGSNSVTKFCIISGFRNDRFIIPLDPRLVLVNSNFYFWRLPAKISPVLSLYLPAAKSRLWESPEQSSSSVIWLKRKSWLDWKGPNMWKYFHIESHSVPLKTEKGIFCSNEINDNATEIRGLTTGRSWFCKRWQVGRYCGQFLSDLTKFRAYPKEISFPRPQNWEFWRWFRGFLVLRAAFSNLWFSTGGNGITNLKTSPVCARRGFHLGKGHWSDWDRYSNRSFVDSKVSQRNHSPEVHKLLFELPIPIERTIANCRNWRFKKSRFSYRHSKNGSDDSSSNKSRSFVQLWIWLMRTILLKRRQSPVENVHLYITWSHQFHENLHLGSPWSC